MQPIKLPTPAEWANAITTGGWYSLLTTTDYLAPLDRVIAAGAARAQAAGKRFEYRHGGDEIPGVLFVRFAPDGVRPPFNDGGMDRWIEDRCDLGAETFAPRRVLWDSYLGWCAEQTIAPLSPQAWNEGFQVMGFRAVVKRVPDPGGPQTSCWQGLALKPVSP